MVEIRENPHYVCVGFSYILFVHLSFEERLLVGCVRDSEYMVNKHHITSTLKKRRGCGCECVCGCV